MGASPLPEGNNIFETLRRLKAIDAEFYSMFAVSGTLGDLNVTGTLTMGPGGVIRTAESGQRVELTSTAQDRVQFFSGNASESAPASIFGDYAGAVGSGNLYLALYSPQASAESTQTRIELKAESADGASQAPEFTVYATGTYGLQPVARLVDFILRVDGGTAASPAYAFNANFGTGAYLISSNVYGIAVGGGNELTLGTTGFKVPNVYDSTIGGAANVHVVSDGRLYLATSTEKYKEAIKPWISDGSILDVQPVTFYPMAGNEKKGEKMKRVKGPKRLGLTFENVLKHFPKGALKKDKGLDWNAITTALLSEVQQLKKRITVLESRNGK